MAMGPTRRQRLPVKRFKPPAFTAWLKARPEVEFHQRESPPIKSASRAPAVAKKISSPRSMTPSPTELTSSRSRYQPNMSPICWIVL